METVVWIVVAVVLIAMACFGLGVQRGRFLEVRDARHALAKFSAMKAAKLSEGPYRPKAPGAASEPQEWPSDRFQAVPPDGPFPSTLAMLNAMEASQPYSDDELVPTRIERLPNGVVRFTNAPAVADPRLDLD